jgi:hypothetical protein
MLDVSESFEHMGVPMSEPNGGEITSPPSKTAGEQDHSDVTQFVGEDAEAPTNEANPTVSSQDGTGPEGEV